MAETTVLHHTTVAMVLVLILSMPPIIIATIVGLIVGLLQALTQIQDQTLPFAFKLIAVIITMLAVAPWLGGELLAFTERVLIDFPVLTR